MDKPKPNKLAQFYSGQIQPNGALSLRRSVQFWSGVYTAQALKDVGCCFLYLPPYSPELNPIEMAFSKLKAHLRRIGARTFDQMFNALAEVCNLFTPQECWNYFCEAGYGSG
jgi:transposase